MSTPTTRTASASLNPSAVAKPIRRPVNDPGPRPTAIQETSSTASPASSSTPSTADRTCCAALAERIGSAQMLRPSASTSPTEAIDVAVSMVRVVTR